MADTISDAERAEVRANFAIYLGKKPTEEQLAKEIKELKNERAKAQKRIQEIMAVKSIPIFESSDYKYKVALITKKRKSAPKVADVLNCVEQLLGKPARERVEQAAKQQCKEVKEEQTLKLISLDNAKSKQAPKRQKVEDNEEEEEYSE